MSDVNTDHEYDGIREFDNPMPRWWLLTFYGTVVFSVGYWLYYHSTSAGQMPMAVYQEEVRRAEEEAERQGKGLSEDELLALGKDTSAVSQGETVYKQNCLVCHGDKGQGAVGPNLTDDYWLHGPKALDQYKTIAGGVLEKGMPAWKPTLGPSKVKQVLGYILTFRGKNVPGKPPQGEKAGP